MSARQAFAGQGGNKSAESEPEEKVGSQRTSKSQIVSLGKGSNVGGKDLFGTVV